MVLEIVSISSRTLETVTVDRQRVRLKICYRETEGCNLLQVLSVIQTK